MMHFLGHDAEYWIELQARFEKNGELSAIKLLDEVVRLRGRLNFYEDRIKELGKVAEHPL